MSSRLRGVKEGALGVGGKKSMDSDSVGGGCERTKGLDEILPSNRRGNYKSAKKGSSTTHGREENFRVKEKPLG